MSIKALIYTLDNEFVEEILLNEKVFGLPVREDLLHRIVHWQRAKKRSGTHSTKGISEISGTGRKPYRQKGTGRARLGSLRVPQARGGAIIFGPRVRDHAYNLPKKVRKLALKTALSAKVRQKKLKIIESLVLETHKTKILGQKLKAFNIVSALIVDTPEFNENFSLAVRNLPRIDIILQQGTNVYDILRHETLILSREALFSLEERLV